MGAFASNLAWALLIAAPVLFGQPITIDSGSPADQFFSGGAITQVITPGATGDLTLRYGAFAYNIPTSPGNYTVSLFMRETGTAGVRRFSVRINGQPVLTDFDLFAVAGLNELRRDFPATSIGAIQIGFTYTLKSAVVSRIVVTPIIPVTTFHLVPVPQGPGPCEDSGMVAIDHDAVYFCAENHPVVPDALPWGFWIRVDIRTEWIRGAPPQPRAKIYTHPSGLLRIDAGTFSVTGSATTPEMKASGWTESSITSGY